MPLRNPYYSAPGFSVAQMDAIQHNFRAKELTPFAVATILETSYVFTTVATEVLSLDVSIPGNCQVILRAAANLESSVGGEGQLTLETVYPNASTVMEVVPLYIDTSTAATVEMSLGQTWVPTPQSGQHTFKLWAQRLSVAGKEVRVLEGNYVTLTAWVL